MSVQRAILPLLSVDIIAHPVAIHYFFGELDYCRTVRHDAISGDAIKRLFRWLSLWSFLEKSPLQGARNRFYPTSLKLIEQDGTPLTQFELYGDEIQIPAELLSKMGVLFKMEEIYYILRNSGTYGFRLIDDILRFYYHDTLREGGRIGVDVIGVQRDRTQLWRPASGGFGNSRSSRPCEFEWRPYHTLKYMSMGFTAGMPRLTQTVAPMSGFDHCCAAIRGDL